MPFLVLIIAYFFRESLQNFIAAAVTFPALGLTGPFIVKGIINLVIAIALLVNFRRIKRFRFGKIKLPMIQYPDCQACECDPETTSEQNGIDATSTLTQLSNAGLYYDNLLPKTKLFANSEDDASEFANN